jgi:superfamily II DNA or RNA helicase
MGDGERVDGDVIVATGQTMQGFRPRVVKQKVGKRKRRVSLPPDKKLRRIVKEFQCIIGDECHRASSDTWYDIFMNSGAKRRYGFSATPLKAEEIADLKLTGATGPLLYECEANALIDAGLAAKPKIVMVMADTVSGKVIEKKTKRLAREAVYERAMVKWEKRRKGKMPQLETTKADQKEVYRVAYRLGIVENHAHNTAVLRAVQWLVDHKRKPLVLCRLKAHWEKLSELFEDAGLPFIAIWGASDKGDRDLAKSAYGSGRTKIVLATTIWDEGEDIPGVDSIVLAEGVRSMTNTLQRIGRGMRRDSKDVWVVDIVPTCHSMLTNQAASRADTYEAEGYEVQLVDSWPAPDEDLDDAEGELLPFLTWGKALPTRK